MTVRVFPTGPVACGNPRLLAEQARESARVLELDAVGMSLMVEAVLAGDRLRTHLETREDLCVVACGLELSVLRAVVEPGAVPVARRPAPGRA
jgi:hypothetical protein